MILMMNTVYGPGGFDPAKANKNVVEQWDSVAGTYTRWDVAGTQLQQRALTPDETAAFAAQYASAASATNTTAICTKLQAAINANTAYLALTGPGNGEVVAQVNRLTRECTALMRLTLNALSTTDGT